jgi:hypothetical protein
MSSEIPPTDYFTGISFNPDFYQSSSEEYLTASTGKSYFLSYPTAQGTETITTLKSSSIDSSSTTTNMAIASAQTSGALNIASLPSRTGNINIGYSTSAPSGLGYNINMGNILSNTSIGGKYIEIAAASSGITISTSGTLDMIATAYNMGTSLVNATNINIGTTGKSTTTIYGPISTVGSITSTGDIEATTGKIKTTTLDAVADTPEGTTALKIGNNVITGTIEIGNAMTTGDIKIGLSDIAGATITVGTASTATTINGRLTTSLGPIAGLLSFEIKNVSYTIVSSTINREYYIVVTLNNATTTFPAPSARTDQIIHIRNATSLNQSITTPSGLLFPNVVGNTYSTWTAFAGNTSQTFYSNGTNWYGFN